MFISIPALLAFSSIGTFLHITDIHYDPLYHSGSPTKCVLGSTGLGCCHKYDIPLKNNTPASSWGNYNCDTPFSLVDATFNWIHQNTQQLDFIIYTGDSASHHDITNIPSIVTQSMSDINSLFQQYFPNIAVYNNLGNHDTWPIDQTTPIEYNKLLHDISKLWGAHLDSISIENIQKGGYYSIMFNNSTRLISFNSIYYDNNNLFKHRKHLEKDPQIQWLTLMLDRARLNHEQVWFISHIFPTAGESTPEYNTIMKQIFWTYRDVIRYQWYGHSHNDQFVLYQHTDPTTNIDTIFSSGVVGPSIMPDKRFPAFRIYKYDTETFQLLDYTQYYSNLTETILENKITYKKQYSFKDAYQLDGLETSDYTQLYNGIINGTHTSQYCKHYTPGFNTCQYNNIIV